MMLVVTLAGNLGRDAEFKTTSSGQEICSFSVGVSVGYGDNKTTLWIDVSKWGKGAEGLARILRKGGKVSASGQLSMREHGGKTYLQCRADHVTVQSAKQDDGQSQSNSKERARGSANNSFATDELSDDIPF